MLAQLLLELLCTITLATRPRLRSIFVAAIPARVRIFHTEQIEIFLPIRAFLRERRIAEAGFNPCSDTVPIHARFIHIVQILVTGDGAATESSGTNRIDQ